MKAPIAALFATTLLLGCVGNNTQSLVIVQNNVPEETNGGCLIPGDVSGVFRQSGLLDVSWGLGYEMYPAVQNNLKASAEGQTITIDPTAFNIQLTRADVEVFDAASGSPLTERFSVPVFKVIGAGESTGLAVEVISPGLAASLADGQTVIAHISVVGERDGSTIRSNTAEFPIDICDGCLFADLGPCADITEEGSINTCNIAQDEMAICCEHSTRGLICPAVPETTTP